MSEYVTRELILLACSIWQGAVLGFWYDLIKTARKLIRHSHAAVSARIVWTLSSGISGKGNQKSRANPRFSRKMAGKKYEKTEKKVEISWEER